MTLISNLHGLTAQAKHLMEERTSPFVKPNTLTGKIDKLIVSIEKEDQRAAKRITELRARIEVRREETKKLEAMENEEIREIERSLRALTETKAKLIQPNGNG
jgi:hypothetical protein